MEALELGIGIPLSTGLHYVDEDLNYIFVENPITGVSFSSKLLLTDFLKMAYSLPDFVIDKLQRQINEY